MTEIVVRNFDDVPLCVADKTLVVCAGLTSTQLSIRFKAMMGDMRGDAVCLIDTAEAVTGNWVSYCCEKSNDVEGVLTQTELTGSRIVMFRVSQVTPTDDSFVVTETKKVLALWDTTLNADISCFVDDIAAKLCFRISVVSVLLGEGAALFRRQFDDFQRECHLVCFGTDDARRQESLHLRDVRLWSRRVVEKQRLSMSTEGPMLLNLNPRPTVGEKFGFIISRGISYILGDSRDGSAVDVVVSGDACSLSSVWSPHCQLCFENGIVKIKPETGLTYVNGTLLADERILQTDDRIILGTEVILRFVNVVPHVLKTGSCILDWEYACKEFCQKINESHQEECEDELPEKYELLKREVGERACGACVVLTNPPDSFHGTNIWSLHDMTEGDVVTIGATADISIPSMKAKASLKKTGEIYLLQIGQQQKKIQHSSRFLVGEQLFLLNDPNARKRGVTPRRDSSMSSLVFPSTSALELRNELFDLQWSISALFDFCLPFDKNGEDSYKNRRQSLASDNIITSEKLTCATVVEYVSQLTEAVRILASSVSAELRGTSANELLLSSMQRVLCERNRTIEQLLLDTESNAPFRWAQVQYIQDSMGRKLQRVAQLEVELESRLGQQPSESASYSVTNAKFNALKADSIFMTPIVLRRALNTVEAVGRSANPRALWHRFLKDLDNVIESSGGIHCIQAHKQQSALLALVDVVVAFDVGKTSWVHPQDSALVDRMTSTWNLILKQCARAVEAQLVDRHRPQLPQPAPQARASSRNNSPTPRQIQHVSPQLTVQRMPSRDSWLTKNDSRQHTSRPPSVTSARQISPASRQPSPAARPPPSRGLKPSLLHVSPGTRNFSPNGARVQNLLKVDLEALKQRRN